jgi:Reverse transcriptase (RNA-dependent DNA polymerase)/N-terminal domain of reverse transcriptase
MAGPRAPLSTLRCALTGRQRMTRGHRDLLGLRCRTLSFLSPCRLSGAFQKLMLRSRSNTLVSVRRVTERNAGRLTAGVDGEVALTLEAKMNLADRIQHRAEPFKAQPVRRVYIPKPGSQKRRPLGIPVLLDRCHQARVVNALEPEWEARFEPRSYGFRPGRGCHDAIQSIYQVVKGRSPRRRWVLDADLAGAFDRIAHDHILQQLGSFPARGMVREWLKAGVVEQGQLHRTEEGTPQGSLCAAAHKPPYAQYPVMRSSAWNRPWLLGLACRALGIIRAAQDMPSSGCDCDEVTGMGNLARARAGRADAVNM